MSASNGGLDLAGLLHHLYFGGGISNPGFTDPGAEHPTNPGATSLTLPGPGAITPHAYSNSVIGPGQPTPAPAPAPAPAPPPAPSGGVHPAIVALLHAIGDHLGGNLDQAQQVFPGDRALARGLHHMGYDAQALQIWEQRHPGAMRTGHHIPGWVRNAMHHPGTAVHQTTMQ